MNEEMQSALVKFINQSLDVFNQGVGFMSEQIPDVVQQLLAWKFTSSLLGFIFFCLCCLIWAYANYRQIKWWGGKNEYGKTRITSDFGPFVIFNVLQALFITLIPNNLFDWLKIWIAPKVWLIEYAASLVK